MAYPEAMATLQVDAHFATEAGERLQQAFTLCAFASQLVGKATEE